MTLLSWFQIVLEADGYQPYLISPEKGLRSLIKVVLEMAKEPARLCVDEVKRSNTFVLFPIFFCYFTPSPTHGRVAVTDIMRRVLTLLSRLYVSTHIQFVILCTICYFQHINDHMGTYTIC